MFENRRGHFVMLKRKLGNGEYIVQTISKASLWRLRREIGKIYAEQKKNDSRASKSPKLNDSDGFFEQWRADNENNLIDLGRH